MVSIGLRVRSNSEIYYCLLEQDRHDSLNYLDVSCLSIPRSLEWPESLSFVRNTVLDLLLQYNVDNAAIRVSEIGLGLTVNALMIERTYIEGVLQVAIADSDVKKYKVGRISEFTSLMGIERADFKKYSEAELSYSNIPADWNWSGFSLEKRETILIANGALNL